MTAIPGYMLPVYNKCNQLGWFTPEFVSNDEFINIFKSACNYHQGKGDFPRYAHKVMKKFRNGSLGGSTITPLHNKLNALVIPRKEQKAANERAAVENAAQAARQVAYQREVEINRLRYDLANVQNSLTYTSQQLANCQAAINQHNATMVALKNQIATEQKSKQALEDQVKSLAEKLQIAQANVQTLAQQIGQQIVTAVNQSRACTTRIEQSMAEVTRLTREVERLTQLSVQQSNSLAALQQSQATTNQLLGQLLQGAI